MIEIPESDRAEVIRALLAQGIFRIPAPTEFSEDILEKARGIFGEALNLPEWNAGENYMNAGMAAVMVYLKETYPWLSQDAIYAVRHECMMYMK